MNAPETALTVPELLERATALFGDQEALKEGSLSLTYRELDALRRQAAKAVVAAGLQHGDRVAIWAPNLHEFIAAAAGLLSVGCVLIPINTRYKGAEATDILRRGKARLLFTVKGFLGVDYPAMLEGEALPDLSRIVLLRGDAAAGSHQQGWADFLRSGESVSDAALAARSAQVQPDDPQDILFTSGTTGKAKGVVTTHRQNLVTYAHFSDGVGIAQGDRYLIINPFFHAFGYKAGWMTALMRGACILPMPVFDPVQTMTLVQEERITFLPGPPSIFQSLLANPSRPQFDLSSLKTAITGSAMIPVELIRRMYAELHFNTVIAGFGMTETCGTVSITRHGDDPALVATTVGRAIEGVSVKIVDSEGRELPTGQAGEVLVRGFNVMLGYLDDPAATAETIDTEGWLHSGDIGTLDADGYLRITDRLKDMIIVGGFNVYPAELENLLAQLPGVAQAAVIGVPDERLGEVAKAFVVRVPGAQLDEEAVLAFCRERISNFKVPRQVVFMDALPMNASNKVLKTELRAHR